MGKLKIVDYQNPALKRIAEMLENAFNEVGEKIRADLLKAYRNHARGAFDNFIRTIKESSGEIPRDRYGRQKFSNRHMFADYKETTYRPFTTWEDMRAVIGKFSLTYKYADRDANDAYEHARDSFIYKNMGKMSEVLGKRSDLKNAVLRFDFRNGAFEGNVQIYLEEAYFRGDVSIKYVIRTIPRVTPYFQYPLIFTEAEVKGRHYARPSEEELRNLLSGKTSEEHQAQKASQALVEGWCPMSGQSVPEKTAKGGRYRACPSCGSLLPPTGRGLFPKHKTRAAQKASAAEKLTSEGYCAMSRQKVGAATIATIGPVSGYSDPKVACEGCGQMTRLDARKDWIFEGVPVGGHATQAKVTSAIYYKHKLA